MSRQTLALVGVLAAVLTLVGCGAGDSIAPAEPMQETTQEQAVQGAATAEAAVATEAAGAADEAAEEADAEEAGEEIEEGAEQTMEGAGGGG